MELARRRESSVQRRAAAAASAERAASCADDLMQVLIEDSATGSKEPRGSKSSIRGQKCTFYLNTGMQITLFGQNLGFQ